MKIFDAILGSFIGGFVTAFCFGILSWFVAYNMDPGPGMNPGPCWGCAHLAAVVAGFPGFVLGLPLGFVISFLNRGLVPGTFLGLALGVIMLILAMQQGGHPDFSVRNPLVLASLPAGILSGFFTALILTLLSRLDDSAKPNRRK
ncbi:MAG TPA: hypothetical protein VFY60_09095 [Pyrinomonadaceae bacterium]|nr:hypothetical protein [Pyrinomonadaceae bacterium]